MAVIKVQSIRDIPKDGVYIVEATNKLYRQGNDRILKIFLDCNKGAMKNVNDKRRKRFD